MDRRRSCGDGGWIESVCLRIEPPGRSHGPAWVPIDRYGPRSSAGPRRSATGTAPSNGGRSWRDVGAAVHAEHRTIAADIPEDDAVQAAGTSYLIGAGGDAGLGGRQHLGHAGSNSARVSQYPAAVPSGTA